MIIRRLATISLFVFAASGCGGGGFVPVSNPTAVREVTPNAAGSIYVVDTFHHAVKRVAPNGTVTTVASGFGVPTGLARDAKGNLYVVDALDSSVNKISTGGKITKIGKGFAMPTGIAVDASGNVYVADTMNDAVKRISPDGQIAPVGKGWSMPTGVALDGAGNLYVSNTGNGAIEKLGRRGDITCVPANVPMASCGGGRAPVIGLPALINFAVANVEGKGQTSLQGFYGPTGLAVDTKGNVYVADTLDNDIKKVTPRGKITAIQGYGLHAPTDVVLNGTTIFVTNSGDNQIQRIPERGQITVIGSGFKAPTGMTY